MRTIVLASLACVLVSAAGCVDGYNRMDISPVAVGDKLKGNFTTAQVTLPAAGVMVVHIAPYNSGNHPMVGDVVSDDPTTVMVVRAEGEKNYALLGAKEGSTKLHLLADGVEHATMFVSVLPQ
jgi:hypothetical protein